MEAGEAEEETLQEDQNADDSEAHLDSVNPGSHTSGSSGSGPSNLPDVEDIVGFADASESQEAPKHEAWIPISAGSMVRKHKASILADCTNPIESKDRLRRVRGYTQYNEAASSLSVDLDVDGPRLHIQDPVATLVRCDDLVFVAVAQIIDIQVAGTSGIDEIPLKQLTEPNTNVRLQIIRLRTIDITHQPLDCDWEWNGLFEATLRDTLAGGCIEPLDPTVQQSSQDDPQTFAFKTSELRGLGALLYERLSPRLHRIPHIVASESFPYRIETGSACFVCEQGENDQDTNYERCRLCADSHTESLTGRDLLSHMGAHILHDPRLKDADSPCGLCLNLGSLCAIRFVKKASGYQIDMVNSRCRNLYKISLKHAAKFSRSSPCTNVLLICPYCPHPSDAVWKYNMLSHLTKVHGGVDLSRHEKQYGVFEEERVLMKAVFLAKPRTSKKRKSKGTALLISEAHSTRIVLTSTLPSDDKLDDDEDINSEGSREGCSDEGLTDDRVNRQPKALDCEVGIDAIPETQTADEGQITASDELRSRTADSPLSIEQPTAEPSPGRITTTETHLEPPEDQAPLTRLRRHPRLRESQQGTTVPLSNCDDCSHVIENLTICYSATDQAVRKRSIWHVVD